jgi:hypothetical protein
MKKIAKTISAYNNLQKGEIKKICVILKTNIDKFLKGKNLEVASKVWHGSPVWFINENPIIAYSTRSKGGVVEKVSLMFFSGQSFQEKDLLPEGKFKAAEIFYTNAKEIKIGDLKRWCRKGMAIQWDYKNIVKNKGKLNRI